MNTKSILRYAAAAAAVFAVLACSKDDTAESGNPDKTAPYTITATMADAPETRISATDDGSSKIELKWRTGDYIHIINGSGTSETKYAFKIGSISADGKTASFTYADYPADATPAYAIHNSLDSFDPANVSTNTEVYYSTTYSLSNNFPLFASYDPATRLLVFKPLLALLKLDITLPEGAAGTLTQLRIGSADGSKIFYNSRYDITSGTAVRTDNTMTNRIKQYGTSSFTGNTIQSVYLPVRPGTEPVGKALEVDLVVGGSVYTATIKGAKLEAGKCYPLTLGAAKWAVSKIYQSGTGTADTPYEIANETNLRALARAVRAGERYSGKYFKLKGNISGIETSAADPWLPIGGSGSSFSGYFDGSNQTVSGTFHLSDKDGTGLGFFGNTYRTSGHSISNLTLAGEVIYNSSNPSDIIYLGAIAGYSDGEISACTHKGALTAQNTAITSYVYAGGIVGFSRKNITGCTQSDGTITVNTPHVLLRTGGIIGCLYESSAAMHTCCNTSNIVATGKTNSTYVGALAGDNNGTVYSCSAFLDGLKITVNGTEQTPAKAIGTGRSVDTTPHTD